MGWPGTGVELRVGIPGRGGGGCACPGAGRAVCCSRARMSARGGTTGRAAGWPAKLGRDGGCDRRGMDGAGVPGVAEGVASAAGAATRARGGMAGPGVGSGGGGVDAGRGCRGPERICPGRGGGGAGRAGIGPVRKGGWMGALPPLDNGGRNGATLRGSSVVVTVASPEGAAGVSGAGDGATLAAMAGCSGARAGAWFCSCVGWGSATAITGALTLGGSCCVRGAPVPWTRCRTNSATSSSTELE